MPKILNIVETAYRATIEEQDDTILWLTQMLKNAGADISILLKGNAVNYAVKGQDASGLTFGELKMSNPPQFDKDLEKMLAKGVSVYLLSEDAEERGLSRSELLAGIEQVTRADLPALFDRHDHIWHW